MKSSHRLLTVTDHGDGCGQARGADQGRSDSGRGQEVPGAGNAPGHHILSKNGSLGVDIEHKHCTSGRGGERALGTLGLHPGPEVKLTWSSEAWYSPS